MGAGIQGASNQGAQQVSQTQQTANKEFIKELKNTQSEILNGFKELSDELGGRIKDQTKLKQPQRDIKDLQKLDKTPEGKEIVESASISAQEEIEKQKRKEERKKKKLEEKINQLSGLLENIDTKQLSKKEKEAIETFKKNAKQLKQLTNRMKMLEKEEDYLEEMLKKSKK